MAIIFNGIIHSPEHISDFVQDLREYMPEDRGPHLSIHFEEPAEIEKWIKVFERQEMIESTVFLARCLFYDDEKKQRLMDASKRTAELRIWSDRAKHLEFVNRLKEVMQWQEDDSSHRGIPPPPVGPDLGPSGLIMGVSCIVCPAERRQTNIIMPFCISQPLIPPEQRKPREPTIASGPPLPGDNDCAMQ
ncbi:hypothetical protein HGRIS_004086 [Hohenbuehelia grisea]|uniref:Uncharacterized protein n=1 Tax=Hohenbuehelia grisea TaxID=104357 RepID=A0ABR3JHS6_9AGAR